MGKKFASMTPKYPHILHGGDYNPDQWIDYPEIVERDIELMKKRMKPVGIKIHINLRKYVK